MEKIDIKREFMKIAGESAVLGSPGNNLSYGYARVSSAVQTEEGASGLPRQLQHIHKAALRDNLAIPFELLFVDDGYSGFEFVDRPAFTRLRHELRSGKRAEHIVVEEIDRLSRNADWHQGFLLDEFARRKVTVHFYHEPSSELERYIKGYIAQEAMRKEKERMRLGKIYKAMDGRVTATRAAYGYQLSDSKDTHYIIDEQEARIVRMVYDWLTQERRTLNRIAATLNDMAVPGRLGGKWSPGTLLNMVKNEVYKGWFITNRTTYEAIGFDDDGKRKRKWRTRPEEEWIRVPVPPLVSAEQWAEAHEVLRSHRSYKGRHSGSCSNWLLSGLIECEICHYVFQAARGGTSVKGQMCPIRYYHCGGRWSHKARALGSACRSRYVHADVLEATVWSKIAELIFYPDHFISYLEENLIGQRSKEFENQLDYLNSQITRAKNERLRWDAAYAREILSLDDYDARVKDIQMKLKNLEQAKQKVENDYKNLQQESDLKNEITRRLEGLRAGITPDIPYELKRSILTILVDKIVMNADTGEGTIFGAIPPTHFEIYSALKSR